jgi:hypothetical protein
MSRPRHSDCHMRLRPCLHARTVWQAGIILTGAAMEASRAAEAMSGQQTGKKPSPGKFPQQKSPLVQEIVASEPWQTAQQRPSGWAPSAAIQVWSKPQQPFMPVPAAQQSCPATQQPSVLLEQVSKPIPQMSRKLGGGGGGGGGDTGGDGGGEDPCGGGEVGGTVFGGFFFFFFFFLASASSFPRLIGTATSRPTISSVSSPRRVGAVVRERTSSSKRPVSMLDLPEHVVERSSSMGLPVPNHSGKIPPLLTESRAGLRAQRRTRTKSCGAGSALPADTVRNRNAVHWCLWGKIVNPTRVVETYAAVDDLTRTGHPRSEPGRSNPAWMARFLRFRSADGYEGPSGFTKR